MLSEESMKEFMFYDIEKFKIEIRTKNINKQLFKKLLEEKRKNIEEKIQLKTNLIRLMKYDNIVSSLDIEDETNELLDFKDELLEHIKKEECFMQKMKFII